MSKNISYKSLLGLTSLIKEDVKNGSFPVLYISKKIAKKIIRANPFCKGLEIDNKENGFSLGMLDGVEFKIYEIEDLPDE